MPTLADLARSAGVGALSNYVGWPVDAVVDLANLYRSGAGYVGHKTGLLGTAQLPELINPATIPGTTPYYRGLLGAGDTLPEQGVEMLTGLLSPSPSAAMNMARKIKGPSQVFTRIEADQAMNMGLLGITVYHGSPHKFDKFDANAPKTTGGSFNKYGASVSPDKKVANRYAKDFGEGGFTYKVDADIKKQLNLSASEFETLQRYVGKIDGGEKLNEVQQISLEMLLEKHGIKSFGHPMKSIKSAGYDAIANDAGRYGSAEREILVFDPQKLKILGIE